jgi:hypothetical protein
MKHIRSYKLFENIEIDTIKDYFSDLIDEGFEIIEIGKNYIQGFQVASHPFQGCTHINYTVKLKMQSDTYKNYQEEYLEAIERFAGAEGLELNNFTTQHKLVSHPKKKYHYYLEAQFKEPFTEEVDIKAQNLQDFEKQLKKNLEYYCRNSSYGVADFNIEKKDNGFVLTTSDRIDTPTKFKTISKWFQEGSKGIDSQSMMFRKISGTFFKYDVDIQRPRFEGRRVVSPGVITITNIN